MDKFTDNLAEGLRKFAYAGMGAISYTVEKSKELIDQLVARGEVTAAEGAAACEDVQKKLTEQVNAFAAKLRTDYENVTFEHMLEKCASLTAKQKAQLLERLTAEPQSEAAFKDAPEETSEEITEEIPEVKEESAETSEPEV